MRKKLYLTVILAGLALTLASTSAVAQRGGFGGGGFGGGDRGRGGFGGGDRGGGQRTGGDRGTQSSGAQVTAVADERSNSVIVSAPEELLPMIEELILEMDSIIQRTAEVRVFPLRYSDAEEMAELVEDMFETRSRGGFRGFGGGSSRSSSIEIETTAEHDVRTNSVVVSADRDKMPLIASMIQTLDRDPARDQKIFMYDLKNANAETVAALLQSIVDQQSGRGSGSSGARPTARTSTSPFAQRSTGNTGGTRGTGGTGGGGTTRR